MTSQHKIEANRSNSLKSSGPRTAGGKQKSSRNSRKHGFAAVSYPAGSAEIEQLAGAICGNEQDAALLVQARIIAENELIWRAIRLHKLSLVERLLAEGRLNESEYFQQTRDRLLVATFEKFKEHLPPLATLRERYSSEALIDTVEEYFEGEDLTAVRKFVKNFLDRQPTKPRELDEHQALELAAPDLDRLERYEYRAWLRQMRAIRDFIDIKQSAES